MNEWEKHAEKEKTTLTRIVSTVPACGDRTSMVTLSVSICSKGSSSSTESPGFLRIEAIVPSVMDSPKGGTCTWRAAQTAAEVVRVIRLSGATHVPSWCTASHHLLALLNALIDKWAIKINGLVFSTMTQLQLGGHRWVSKRWVYWKGLERRMSFVLVQVNPQFCLFNSGFPLNIKRLIDCYFVMVWSMPYIMNENVIGSMFPFGAQCILGSRSIECWSWAILCMRPTIIVEFQALHFLWFMYQQ